jgi:hypothetical protein
MELTFCYTQKKKGAEKMEMPPFLRFPNDRRVGNVAKHFFSVNAFYALQFCSCEDAEIRHLQLSSE